MLLFFISVFLLLNLDATIPKSRGMIKLRSEVQGRKRNKGAVGD